MPVLNLKMLPGATRAQKQQVVEQFTETLITVLGKQQEHIHIIFEEISRENWASAGNLLDKKENNS